MVVQGTQFRTLPHEWLTGLKHRCGCSQQCTSIWGVNWPNTEANQENWALCACHVPKQVGATLTLFAKKKGLNPRSSWVLIHFKAKTKSCWSGLNRQCAPQIRCLQATHEGCIAVPQRAAWGGRRLGTGKWPPITGMTLYCYLKVSIYLSNYISV